jgi:hypothetical protein
MAMIRHSPANGSPASRDPTRFLAERPFQFEIAGRSHPIASLTRS